MAGERGMQYDKKSFSVGMGSGPVTLTLEEQREIDASKQERELELKRVQLETQARLKAREAQKKTKILKPYGTRILVKRRPVEEKSAHIILTDETKGLPTDVADVIDVPEQTFTDQKLIANAGNIIEALAHKACAGDSAAVRALLDFREYLQVMTIKKGDVLLMARYGGTDFEIDDGRDKNGITQIKTLCVCEASGIYAFIRELPVQPAQGG